MLRMLPSREPLLEPDVAENDSHYNDTLLWKTGKRCMVLDSGHRIIDF